MSIVFRPGVAALALATSAVLVPVVASAATPKPDGLYLSKPTSKDERIAVALTKGAIDGGSAEVRLTKHGKGCKVPGLNPSGKPFATALVFNQIGSLKLTSGGSFSFRGRTTYGSVQFPFRVRGRFTSSTRATVAIRASSSTGCGGYFKTTKAVWHR